MQTMNGGQVLMGSLQRMGTDMVFGVPGAGQYEAVDALYGHASIRYVSARHEQETTFMADAYAQIAGKPAVALVVPGPGLFYAGAGLVSAFANSAPVLLVTGSNADPALSAQSLELTALATMTKWAGQVADISEIPAAVHEAFRQMATGRPRPTGLVIPAHILAQKGAVRLPAGPPAEPRTAAPGVEQAAAWLQQARRPLFWVGAGVIQSGAVRLVRELSAAFDIPVVTTRKGKGIVGEEEALGLGLAEMRYAPLRRWILARDLVVAVGASQSFAELPMRVIRIDRDETLTVTAPNRMGLPGDARATLEALRACLSTTGHAPVSNAERETIRALKADRWAPQRQLQPQWDFMQAIRAAAPADAIFVQGMNQMGYYSRNYLPLTPAGRLLTASSQATLGAAYPMSLGAKLAHPQRPVVALAGDGGFLYSAPALATAVQQKIHSAVLVFNDNAYGNVLRAQKEEFAHRVLGTRLRNPDFVALARSFGAHGRRAANAAELARHLDEALRTDAHTLIEIPVGELERHF